MANWCDNSVEFAGEKRQLALAMKLFKDMSSKGSKTGGQLPYFIDKSQPHFFDIRIDKSKIFYDTEWEPNNQVLREIANHFKVDFVNNYDQLDNGLYGKAIYDGKVMLDVRLEAADFYSYDFDPGAKVYLFEGETYEYVMPILDLLLERRVVEAMKILNSTRQNIAATNSTGEMLKRGKVSFASEGTVPGAGKTSAFINSSNISAQELTTLYGELLQGDLLLKFAEHGNYDGAKVIFDTFDEDVVIAT